jgi:hypothetical protein
MSSPKKSSPKKGSSRKKMDRRSFIKVAGGAAALSPFALSGAAKAPTKGSTAGSPFSRALSEPTETSFLGISPDMDLMVYSIDYVEQALAEANGIYGQMDILEQRWEEVSTLWNESNLALRDPGCQMQIVVEDPDGLEPQVFNVDLVTPFITLDEFLANEQQNLADLQAVAASDNARKVIAKLMAIFGLKEFSQAIFELLEAEGLIAELDAALSSGSLKAIGRVLKKILNKLISKTFLKKLAGKVGAKAAARIVGKIAARFVPYVGWALLIGSLLWAIGEQIFG